MQPEPLLRVTKDELLDAPGEQGRVGHDVGLVVAPADELEGRLEAEVVEEARPVAPPIGGDHRHAVLERDAGGSGHGGGELAEEGDEDGALAVVLVDEHGHHAALAQMLEDGAERRAAAVHDRLVHALAQAPGVPVEERVVHGPRDREDRAGDAGRGEPAELPVAHVGRDDDGAPALVERRAQVLLALEAREVRQVAATEDVRDDEALDERCAEVLVDPADEGAGLVGAEAERARDVRLGHRAVPLVPETDVEAQRAPQGQRHPDGHRGEGVLERADRRVLGDVAEPASALVRHRRSVSTQWRLARPGGHRVPRRGRALRPRALARRPRSAAPRPG